MLLPAATAQPVPPGSLPAPRHPGLQPSLARRSRAAPTAALWSPHAGLHMHNTITAASAALHAPAWPPLSLCDLQSQQHAPELLLRWFLAAPRGITQQDKASCSINVCSSRLQNRSSKPGFQPAARTHIDAAAEACCARRGAWRTCRDGALNSERGLAALPGLAALRAALGLPALWGPAARLALPLASCCSTRLLTAVNDVSRRTCSHPRARTDCLYRHQPCLLPPQTASAARQVRCHRCMHTRANSCHSGVLWRSQLLTYSDKRLGASCRHACHSCAWCRDKHLPRPCVGCSMAV